MGLDPPHVVFAYNSTIHSLTGFTPFYLMFGSEARFPGELLATHPVEDETPSSYAFKHHRNLELAFSSARENTGKAQLRSKNYYDLGATKKIFQVGDRVRIRLTTVGNKPGSKLKPFWSDVCDVLNVNGLVITVCNALTKQEFRVHADRLLHVSPHLRYEKAFLNENRQTNSNLPTGNVSRLEAPPSGSESEGNENPSLNVPLDKPDFLSRNDAAKRPVKGTQNKDYAYILLMNIDKNMSSGKSSASSYQSAQSVVPASTAASAPGGVAAAAPAQTTASLPQQPGVPQLPGRQSARSERAMTSTPVAAHGPSAVTPAPLPNPQAPHGTPVIGSNGRGGEKTQVLKKATPAGAPLLPGRSGIPIRMMRPPPPPMQPTALFRLRLWSFPKVSFGWCAASTCNFERNGRCRFQPSASKKSSTTMAARAATLVRRRSRSRS